MEEFRTRCSHFAVLHFCWRSLCRRCPPFLRKARAAPHPARRRTKAKSRAKLAQNQLPARSRSAAETQGQISVQARIRLRREQRRATAIHDAYDHRWETYLDMGYLRFTPGPSLQRLTYYAWETGLTRFSTERLGYTLDRPRLLRHGLRGPEPYQRYHPARHQPVRRALAAPSIASICSPNSPSPAARWAAGPTATSPATPMAVCRPSVLALYPRRHTPSRASASVIGEYNLTPSVGFKLAPEYFFTGFGSTVQASRGFTGGIVYRLGKQ